MATMRTEGIGVMVYLREHLALSRESASKIQEQIFLNQKKWLKSRLSRKETEERSRSQEDSVLYPRRDCDHSDKLTYYMGSHSLLQGIFPIQGLSPGLPHCRQILYQLSHQGSSRTLEWVAYPFSRGSSWPRNWTRVCCIAGRFFTSWATREAHV